MEKYETDVNKLMENFKLAGCKYLEAGRNLLDQFDCEYEAISPKEKTEGFKCLQDAWNIQISAFECYLGAIQKYVEEAKSNLIKVNKEELENEK